MAPAEVMRPLASSQEFCNFGLRVCCLLPVCGPLGVTPLAPLAALRGPSREVGVALQRYTDHTRPPGQLCPYLEFVRSHTGVPAPIAYGIKLMVTVVYPLPTHSQTS